MLKVAVIGCGKIADSHVSAIGRVSECKVVAICDREPRMTQQLGDRFLIPARYTDPGELLGRERPDVVHITTPPQSHFAIARQCLEAGANVFVEKPFTVTTAEAEELVAVAERSKRLITVGHDEQFSHAALRMRTLVAKGYLGGAPVHMESIWCYSLGDQMYAKALLGDSHHWVRHLPGGLLHNVISHGVSKIAEFLSGDTVEVVVVGFPSPFLERLGENRIVDELRVVVTDRRKTTAYFTFSSQMRPPAHQLFLYGPANGVLLDEDKQLVIRLHGARRKSYLEQFVPPLDLAKQHVGNWAHNVRLFLARDFHSDAGRKNLIEAFYQAIRQATPPPIPYAEILLTSRIMDAIFEQLHAQTRQAGRSGVATADHALAR